MKVMAGVSSGGAGHLNPLLPLLRAFIRRGDDVVVVTPPSLVSMVEAAGLNHRVGSPPERHEAERIAALVRAGDRRDVGHLIDMEVFGRLGTAAMLPAMEAAADEWAPDLVIREPCEYSSAVVAARRRLYQAQVGISLTATEDSVLDLVAPVLDPYVRGLSEMIREFPFISHFPASLDPSPFPHTYRISERLEAAGELPDFWGGRDGPLIYVTLGSVTGGTPDGHAAYRAALDAVEGLSARVLLTVGRSFDPATLGPLPDHIHVEAWVPQADVLEQADLVVCHGGSGTTFGALAAGVPLVILPMFADQPTNGRLVESAGAGLVVEGGDGAAVRRVGPADVPALRHAIEAVLADASYAAAARGLSAEMRSLPTADEVVSILAQVCSIRPSSRPVPSGRAPAATQ
jgi:UDP:flavonoid glycosyltransferase YjiC (YdhE family)